MLYLRRTLDIHSQWTQCPLSVWKLCCPSTSSCTADLSWVRRWMLLSWNRYGTASCWFFGWKRVERCRSLGFQCCQGCYNGGRVLGIPGCPEACMEGLSLRGRRVPVYQLLVELLSEYRQILLAWQLLQRAIFHHWLVCPPWWLVERQYLCLGVRFFVVIDLHGGALHDIAGGSRINRGFGGRLFLERGWGLSGGFLVGEVWRFLVGMEKFGWGRLFGRFSSGFDVSFSHFLH